jgi:hypothetical protein
MTTKLRGKDYVAEHGGHARSSTINLPTALEIEPVQTKDRGF